MVWSEAVTELCCEDNYVVRGLRSGLAGIRRKAFAGRCQDRVRGPAKPGYGEWRAVQNVV